MAAWLLLCGGLSAAEWKVQVVDAGGGGKFSALQIDKAGNAHVVYVNEPLRQLKYAFWDRAMNKWFTMLVDDRCEGFSSLALDSKQRPHIAYLEYGTGRLKYAHWDGVSWKREAIQLSAERVEYYTSIVLDSEDHPMISYYEVLPPGHRDYLLHLRRVRWTGEYWQVDTIDATRGSGKFNSLAINSAGHLSAAYANVRAESASLRYARWNGTAWDVEILEGAQQPQPVYSVFGILDDHDTPHIAYIDVKTRQVKYATRQNGRWQLTAVDSLDELAYPDRNGMAMDGQGTPYLSYYDAGHGELKVAYRVDARWMAEVVDTGFAGHTSSIRIAHGEIMVTYLDGASNSLKCARRPLERAISELKP